VPPDRIWRREVGLRPHGAPLIHGLRARSDCTFSPPAGRRAGTGCPPMKNPIFHTLTRAIDSHRLVVVTDEAGMRVIEPHLIFESKSGDMLLHGWQRSGAFRSTPPPRFCNLHLDDILAVRLGPERFAGAHDGYNPRSAHFHRVLYELDLDMKPSASADHSGSGRANGKPRQGPPSRAAGDAGETASRFRRT
jgi:hypothetical protein